MEELLRTNDPTEVTFATALLKAEGIEPFIMDVHMSTFQGSVGILPRRIMVRKDQHFRATAILRDNELLPADDG